METTVKVLNNFGFIPQNNLNSYAPLQKQMCDIYICKGRVTANNNCKLLTGIRCHKYFMVMLHALGKSPLS